MIAKAILKYARRTPRKVNLVLETIRGRNVDYAFMLLKTLKQGSKEEVSKTLKSAVSNAYEKGFTDSEKIFVSEAYATEGLVADFAREHKAVALIRGLRHVSDFEFEFQMATMNHHLNSEVSTLLMVTSEKYIHLNSSVVKDVARLKGNISNFVPPYVMEKLRKKFNLN